jgi:AraC family transcriptional regulator
MRMEPAGSASVDLREGRPESPVIGARELKVFDAIEVGYLRLLAGEVELLPFDGHLVNVHLSVPNHVLQRRNERTHEGLGITGAVDVIPAGTPAYFRMGAASEHACMLLTDRFIRRVAQETGADPDAFKVAPFFNTPDPTIERIGMSLLSEMKTGGLGGELFAESLANVLALHLLRSHSSLGSASRRRLGSEGGASKRSLERATDYINDNLSQKLTLAEIAEAAYMSPRHFSRSFKKDTGLSPHRYVIHRRVERAKALLANTDLNLAEIARAVGFANHSHLSSHLRRLLGVSPGALRGWYALAHPSP